MSDYDMDEMLDIASSMEQEFIYNPDEFYNNKKRKIRESSKKSKKDSEEKSEDSEDESDESDESEEESEDKLYKEMFEQFSLLQSKDINEQLSKNDVSIDDILMQINLDENIDKENKDIEDLIDKGLETRFFQNDPGSFLNSRVGMTERAGQAVNLSTIIQGVDKRSKRQEAINRIYMNSQEIFNINFYKACTKYGIDNKRVEGLMDLLFTSEYFEYKNPYGILFGFMCLKGKNISENLLTNVYEKYAIHENISILDLIRYARFIISLY